MSLLRSESIVGPDGHWLKFIEESPLRNLDEYRICVFAFGEL